MDLSLWAQFGLAGLVVGFAMLRDWHRERALTDRLAQHEAWIREKLLAMCAEVSRHMEANTQALRQLCDAHDRK